jgi:hypothetical protein
MIVTGKTEQEHLKNLDNVLSRMQRFGLRANLNKCYFFKENVTYCGHEIGSDGLKKSQESKAPDRNVLKPDRTSQVS